MHLVYVARQLEVGVVSGEQSRAGRGKYDTRQEEESHNWIPAEDNFQLATVQLAPVRQAHDALLVASQVLRVHILTDRRTDRQTEGGKVRESEDE